MATFKAQHIMVITHAMNFTGVLTKEGFDVPRKHDEESEVMFREVGQKINNAVQERQEKNELITRENEQEKDESKKKELLPMTEVELSLGVKEKAWIFDLIKNTLWGSGDFVIKNEVLELLNQ